MEKGVIGLDFGSLSCRGILMRSADGAILAEEVYPYSHGILESFPDGSKVPDGYVLQDPHDFRDALVEVIRSLLASPQAHDITVTAVGIDATASTVIPVLENFEPLCSLDSFKNCPDAYAIMWKDHRASAEAVILTDALQQSDPAWLAQFGGSIGAEALITKVMHICRNKPGVFSNAYSFMEMGDWLTSLLTGMPTLSKPTLICKNLYRNHVGYPGKEFFEAIDRRLSDIPSKIIPWKADKISMGYPGQYAGKITKGMANKLGLKEITVVTFAQMDGYAGLVGAGVAGSGRLVLTCGTSTGFFMLSKNNEPVHGVCASVRDSMVPGYTGIAAGQASAGDSFAWFVDHALPASYLNEAKEHAMDIHSWLCQCIRNLPGNVPHLLALDWMNGNKSPLNRSDLSSLILGITLDTKPEQIYRAMMEATAFGAKCIIDVIESQGNLISGIIAVGGIAQKNPMLMQIYADVLQKPIEVLQCLQTAALGSAVSAIVAETDGYSRWEDIASRLKRAKTTAFFPDQSKKQLYKELYRQYLELSDYFSNVNPVMAELRTLY